jgi:ABC-type antimicrobial peptide transport system permease subunit
MESSLGTDLLQAVKEVGGPDVERVAPMIFRRMRIEERVMQVRAVTREDMEIVNRLSLVQGKWPQADDELIASEGAIQITHWSLGRVIKVYGSDFHLVGIASASGSRYSSLWMTLHAGEKLFGAGRGYQIILMQLKPGSNVEGVRAAVESRVKQLGRYSAYLEDQVSDRFNQYTGSIRRLNLVEVLIALLAMTFGTYNATSLTLVERSRELSILRVVGFRTVTLRAFLFVRTLLQTLLAYLIGLGLALLFVQNRQALNPIVIQAQSMPLSLPAWSVVSGIALVVCFSALGVWLPTQSYFRISVADQARG